MSLSDDLAKLHQLHERGALSNEEFTRAKARLLNGTPTAPPAVLAVNTLRRSANDRWLGGVCGGVAVATGVAAWVWRALFVLLMVCAGTGALLYLLMWIFVPLEEASPPVARLPAG